MNDIETDVYDRVARAIEAELPDTYVTDDYVNVLPKMPAVTIEQLDLASHDPDSTVRADGKEWYNTVYFQIDAYSNLTAGRKAQAKQLIELADREMIRMGFWRMSLRPLPNMDPDLYRYTATYRAVVSHDHTIYRR